MDFDRSHQAHDVIMTSYRRHVSAGICNKFLISQNILADLKGQKQTIISTLDDVRGDF